jgi:hypothetical protein
MRTLLRAARAGLPLLLLLLSATATCAGTLYTLGSSTEIPAAQGDVRLRHTRNGNTEIKLDVKHLAPPGRITPGADVFVVWVRGLAKGSEAQNLGALRVDKNLNAKMTAATPLQSFDLFITCETSQTATYPALMELLPMHYSAP